jgi:hypothetical protein
MVVPIAFPKSTFFQLSLRVNCLPPTSVLEYYRPRCSGSLLTFFCFVLERFFSLHFLSLNLSLGPGRSYRASYIEASLPAHERFLDLTHVRRLHDPIDTHGR